VKQGAGRAGWQIWGGEARKNRSRKDFSGFILTALVECNGRSAPRKPGVQEGVGLGQLKLAQGGSRGICAEPRGGWRSSHGPKGEGIILSGQVMLLQVMRDHPSLARVPPFEPHLWGFSRCLCGEVHPTGMGSCGKGIVELFNPSFPPTLSSLHCGGARSCAGDAGACCWVSAVWSQPLPPCPARVPGAALGRGWG